MKIPFISFEQPIGEFALSVMSVKDILSISVINRREFDQISLDSKGGPQREESKKRVNEIMRYSETPDATFPTPILLGLPPDKYKIVDNSIEIDDNSSIASIVDGQHRILGLAKSKNVDDFMLPVVFLLDANDEQMALVFAIINGKQTRVSGSVIFDLFNVVEGRNPYKTAHEIARALNSDSESPFFRRLKMLGKKIKESETLSQGTFITHLIKHISSNPDEDFNLSRSKLQMKPRPNSVFNSYFLQGKDEVILRILSNLFKAVKITFADEWEKPNEFILSKTTGYTGIMKSFSEIYKIGEKNKILSYEYFKTIFDKLKQNMIMENVRLTSQHFPPNNTGESKLRDKIIVAAKQIYPES